MTLLPLRLELIYLLLSWIFKRIRFYFPFTAQNDIRAAPSHICRDGNRTWATGLGNDLCLLGMKFGIKHFMIDFLFLEIIRKYFRRIN